jgi:hypothetical protein
MIHSDAFVLDSRAIVHKDERTDPRTSYLVERLEP